MPEEDEEIELPVEAGEIEAEDPQTTIAALQKQLADERAERAKLAEVVNRSQAETHSVKTELAETNLHLLSGALETLNTNQAQLARDYELAFSSGDARAAAEIQREMGKIDRQIEQVEAGKKQLESQPKIVAPAPVEVDPVEAVAKTLHPLSAKWIREHPEYVKDARLNRKMVRAHEDATDAGIASNTPAYFDFMENTLGLKDKPAEAMAEAAQQVSGRQSSQQPPAAPPTRGGASKPGSIRLSAAEIEVAEMYVGTKGFDGKVITKEKARQDYADQKAKIMKDGQR